MGCLGTRGASTAGQLASCMGVLLPSLTEGKREERAGWMIRARGTSLVAFIAIAMCSPLLPHTAPHPGPRELDRQITCLIPGWVTCIKVLWPGGGAVRDSERGEHGKLNQTCSSDVPWHSYHPAGNALPLLCLTAWRTRVGCMMDTGQQHDGHR